MDISYSQNAVLAFLHFSLSLAFGTFSSELLSSVVERCLLPGSSTIIYSSRRNIPYMYCPERRKILEVKRESVSKELQSLIT